MDATTTPPPASATLAGSPAPAPRRRGLGRFLLRLFLVLVVLVLLAPLALRLPFVRSWVAARAGRSLGAPVELAGLKGWWTSGVDVEGLVVKSPDGFDGPLVTVDRVHVDVGLLALVRGRVEAEVSVEHPVLSIRKGKDGRWNHEAVWKHMSEEPASSSASGGEGGGEGSKPAVHVEVKDGAVEAHGIGNRVERISDIDVTVDLTAAGAMGGTLGALVEKAGAQGAGVQISLSGGLEPGAERPLEVNVPDLDLRPLAGLVEGLTGWKDLVGTVRLDAKGTLDGDGGFKGRLALAAERLEAHGSGGSRVALGGVDGKVDVTRGPTGDLAVVSVVLERVDVTAGTGADAKQLSEPKVTATLRAQHARDDRIHVEKLLVEAGQALKVVAPAPLEISASGRDGRRFAGRVDLTADLARLAALKTFVPKLKSLRSGVVSATFDGRSAEGLDVGIGARLTNLALDAGDIAPEGYEEADATVQARVSRAADGALALQVHGLTSALARLQGTKPFTVRRSAAGTMTFDGPLDLTVDLAPLSRLAGRPLGLALGERLGGTLSAKGSTAGDADDGRFEVTLAGRDIAFPPSWSRARTPGALDGGLTVRWTRSALLVEVKDLRALGVTAAGQAGLKRDAVSTAFDSAELTVGADLPQVSERFGAKLGIDSPVLGQVTSTVKVGSGPAGRRIEGTTRVASFSWTMKPDAAPLEEPALTVEHTLAQAPGDAPWRVEVFRARGNGYVLDLSGSSVATAPERKVDLQGTLDGDAARLAERVRAFLGSEYRDLTGSGKVAGRVRFAASGADLVAGGTADVDLALGTWSGAGATLTDGRLTAKRPAAAGPYQVALVGGLNQGTASTTLALEPRGAEMAWQLGAVLKAVDLSTLLVNHGAGKYLGYVLPTLVPMDKATPMMSGRLEADVTLAANALSGDPVLASLAGRGRVDLTQGTLGESTLFAAIGGGNGLGDVGKALMQVVPEVGQELANLQHTLAFQSLSSRFEVGQRRVDVKETHLVGNAMKLDLTGTVQFDQHVDLAAKLWIGSRAGDRLKSVVPDQTLPLKITNTLDKPRVMPDLKASDILKGALPNLLPGGESPEDVKKRLEDELKKRIKNPFK